jgi:hypothetical protein
MLGAVVAGLACWERSGLQPERSTGWLVAGWLLVALGLALKIIAGCLLVPLVLVIRGDPGVRRILTVGSALLPAVLWYAWAGHLIGMEGGSRASADNRAIWMGVFGPTAFLHWETLSLVFRSLLIRSFTPLGATLALVGLWPWRGIADDQGRLWRTWGTAVLIMMVFLSAKLHHEYYWLILAPVVAVGVGRSLDRLMAWRQECSLAVTTAFVLVCWLQACSTWNTPPEWSNLPRAAQVVAATVASEEWVIAPEALLFQADRRGCRLEWTPSSVARAAGEWGVAQDVQSPIELVEYYRQHGVRYFADLRGVGSEPRRKVVHEAVKRRYKVIVECPDVMIADLVVAEKVPHAN